MNTPSTWLPENKKMSGTIWQPDAIGADGDTAELGRDNARSRATEERAGKQWVLIPLSAHHYSLPDGIDTFRKVI